MRQDVPDVDHLPAVFDRGDKPVLVAPDIEHRERTHHVRVRKIFARLHQTLPSSPLGNPVPVHERLQRSAVCPGKLGDRRLADDPHSPKVTKMVTGYQAARQGMARRSRESYRNLLDTVRKDLEGFA